MEAVDTISFGAYFEAARGGESFFCPIEDTGESYWALEKKMWLATKFAGSIVGFGKKQVLYYTASVVSNIEYCGAVCVRVCVMRVFVCRTMCLAYPRVVCARALCTHQARAG